MSYPYLNNWQRGLSRKGSLIFIGLFIFLFMCYEYILFSRLSAEIYYNQGLYYSEKARSAPREILFKKSLFYQDALKLFKRSLDLNPYDARLFFECGQIITEMADDSELRSSVDIKIIGKQEEGFVGLYNLAKSYYEKAISREPTNAIYHQRLGSICDKLSDMQGAEKEFRKALLLDPQNISIHLYLSQYFLSKDRQADFLYHLDKVVQLYKAGLRGGLLSNMVGDFLQQINREDLIR
jgi:tetratricopeptide (TPR) repeat protein